MTTNEKVGTGATVTDLGNHLIADNNQSDFVVNYDQEFEILQGKLNEHLLRNKKIVRLHRCFGCNRNFSIKKMSNILIFCRGCFATAQDKKQVARRNFIDRALNQCRIYLGGRI